MLERSEASQGGEVIIAFVYPSTLRFFVVPIRREGESGLLQNDKKRLFSEEGMEFWDLVPRLHGDKA